MPRGGGSIELVLLSWLHVLALCISTTLPAAFLVLIHNNNPTSVLCTPPTMIMAPKRKKIDEHDGMVFVASPF